MTPEICPNCGALVPEKALACPECGADEDTGWSDGATGQRLGLPEEDFDYDEFIKNEFREKTSSPLKVEGLSWFWWSISLAALYLIFRWLF